MTKTPTLLHRMLSVLLAVMMLVSSSAVTVFADGGDAVDIPDEALRKVVCAALGKDSSADVTITQEDMASLTALDAAGTDVVSIEGLQYAVNLESLDLSRTRIASSKTTMSDEMQYLLKLTKLNTVKLSGLGQYAYGSNWEFTFNAMVAPAMPSLEHIDLSDNGFEGPFYLSYYYDYKYLKTLDLSDNEITVLYKGGGGNLTADYLSQIEKIDLSGNAVYVDESAPGYAGYVAVGIEKFDFSGQRNLSQIKAVYVQPLSSSAIDSSSAHYACDENGVFDLGNVYGDTVTVAFKGTYCGSATTKAEVNGEKYTVMASDTNQFTIDRIKVSLDSTAAGEHLCPVSVMHMNGDTSHYTIRFNKSTIPAPVGDDAAGITDPALYQAVMTKLKINEDGHVITKAEMAKITRGFNVGGVKNAEGIQYATGITSLALSGSFDAVPDLSGMTKVTSVTIISPNVTQVPDFTKLTKLKSLTLSIGADQEWSVADLKNLSSLTLGSADAENKLAMPTGTAGHAKLTLVRLYNYPAAALKERIGQASSLSLNLYDCGKLTDLSALSGTPSVALTISGSTAADLTTLKNVPQLGIKVQDVEGKASITPVGEGTALTSYAQTGSAGVDTTALFNGSADTLTSVSYTKVDMSALPEALYGLKAISKISVKSCPITELDPRICDLSTLSSLSLDATKVTDLPDGFGKLQSMTVLQLLNSDFEEIPASVFQLKDLQKLWMNVTKLHTMEGNWGNLKNLTELQLENGLIMEIPQNLKEATALKTIDMRYQSLSAIPQDALDGLDALTSVHFGTYFRAKMDDSGYYYDLVDEDLLPLFEKLEARGVKTDYDMPVSYAELKMLETSAGNIYFSCTGENRDQTIYVPKGTTEFTFSATPAKSDTVMTYNGETLAAGQTVKVENLQPGSNTVTLTSYNPFIFKEGVRNNPITYSINVYVGDFVDQSEFPQNNHTYMIEGSILQKSSDEKSMSAQYMSEYFQVKYTGGRYAVDLTVKKNGWLPSMRYMESDGTYVDAKKVSEDIANDAAVWRLHTDDLSQALYISPYVTPMGYSPVCRIVFNMNRITDITDSLPAVDFTELNIAINDALALADLRNIYTDDSYTAFLTALEAAQKAAAEPLSSQEEVDAARDALIAAMDALVVDQSKLAHKAALSDALTAARAVEKGNHTDTAWAALQDAIADAQAVYDDLHASQREVDAAVKALNTAVTLFQASGDASDLDKNNLADGVYSVYVDMIKMDRENKSMSDNAINHTVKLEVKDGRYYVTLDFKGITIENRFGYLKDLSYYADGYAYDPNGSVSGDRIPAQVLTTQKNSDGSDVIDQYNDADSLYPDLVKLPLVPQAIADPDGYVPLHVFVPIMEAIAQGNGDQDVLMKVDWSTLKATTDDDPGFQPEEPEEQSPAVDVTDERTGVRVRADKGVLPAGVRVVITQITSGSDYDSAARTLSDVGRKFRLYEVRFVDENGQDVRPNGPVTVSYPVAAGYNQAALALYRLNADGTKTLVKGSADSGLYTVSARTFGKTALVEKGSTITDAENSAIHGGVRTGDAGAALWLAPLTVSAALLALIAGKKRKTERGE